ncbi:hypothetical protein [Streptosporangium sp. NPDC000396]|uniref:hypothetical protein n=1 Tax=Streptosporangium sp. NPDC000396 TaxID=3366185 RepID=UPI0036B99211
MADDELVIDADGRSVSGRGFQNLADHYAQLDAQFQGHLDGEPPMAARTLGEPTG